MLWSFGQVHATMLDPGMRVSSIFNTQKIAACRNKVAKRRHHARLNNVATCCIEMLRSFGRGLQMLGQQCYKMCCVYMLQSFGRGRGYFFLAVFIRVTLNLNILN